MMKASLKTQTCLLALILFTGLTSPAFAQKRAALRGLIADEAGRGVKGAAVFLINALSGESFNAISDEQGRYEFERVRPGNYRVEARGAGFADYASESFNVADEAQTRHITLLVGAVRDQVVVSASRREELARDSAVPTTLIERQEIEDSATQTLEQLLIEQAGSGVYVSRSFGIGFPAINGVGGNRVLVLVDGQRQVGTDNGTRDGIDLDQFTTERVGRVEIVKGAASALYGSDAMGGVINLVGRQPDKPFALDFSNSYGSFGERNFGLTPSFKRGKWAGIATGVYQSFDGYDLNPANSGTTGFSGGENGFIDRQLSPALFYDATSNLRVRLRSNFYRRYGYFLSNTAARTSIQRQERWNVAPTVEFNLGSRTFVTTRGDVSVARRFDTDRVESLKQFEAFGASLFNSSNQVQYGFEYRNKFLRRPGLGAEEDITRPLGVRGTRTIDVKSVWGQYEAKLFGNRLTASAGLRVEDNSQFGSNVSPKTGLVFAPAEAHRVRFAYGEGFRAPDVSELYLGFSPGSFAFVGNPKLTPEESRSFSAGYTFFTRRLQYSLDLFYNRFDNGIGFDQVNLAAPFDPFFNQFIPLLRPGQQLFTNRNLGDLDARGLNSSLVTALPFGFNATFNYTLLERVTVDANNPARNGQRLIGLGNVRNSAFLKFGWAGSAKLADRRFALRANFRGLVRGREPLSTTTTFSRPTDPARVGQIEFVPAYQTWDFYASADLPVSEGRFTLQPFFEINNLANFMPRGLEYADGARVVNTGTDPTLPVFREPGRVFQGGFRVRF
ncbi:MAG: TonB-dependent receptor [Acidobacteria bacterium]|nr:TonB-dependent receptor [Acidobacteriota bacterium]